MDNVFIAFAFTLLAGLATGIGSLIALLAKKTNTRFLAFSLGLSAGVMIFVSMVELYADASRLLSNTYGARMGSAYTALSFFGGMALIALIDKLLPAADNPHELKMVEDMQESGIHKQKLMRTGVFTAIAIAVHNFPEGMATFVSAMQDPKIALPILLAISIHNIPEGIAISVPVYYATGSRRKAFKLSFLSGLSEPLGALIGYLVLLPFMNDTIYAILFAGIAGIMVFISVDELLPSAREYGEHHLSIYGMVLGMMIMAVSLVLFV